MRYDNNTIHIYKGYGDTMNIVKISAPISTEIYTLDIMTVEQFIENNNSAESLAWCNGYLISFSHFDAETFDKGILENIWRYRAIDVAPLPTFQNEIQSRYTKIPIFNKAGSKHIESIIEHIKENEGNRLQ